MDHPVVKLTLQACVLSFTSNVLAQFIAAYRTNAPFAIDLRATVQFLFFTVLSTPPNVLWQTFLESAFPGYHIEPSRSAIEAAAHDDEKELDKEEATNEIVEQRLNLRNTAIKFTLDQTVGATVNTLMFSLIFAGLHGATLPAAWQQSKQEFWPIMMAGFKLWPIVSLVNFSMIKTVEGRSLVGSLAGMAWNVYLSLLADR